MLSHNTIINNYRKKGYKGLNIQKRRDDLHRQSLQKNEN